MSLYKINSARGCTKKTLKWSKLPGIQSHPGLRYVNKYTSSCPMEQNLKQQLDLLLL